MTPAQAAAREAAAMEAAAIARPMPPQHRVPAEVRRAMASIAADDYPETIRARRLTLLNALKDTP